MDRITITGLEAFGYHGVLPHERTYGQRFVVDVALDVDLGEAAASDDLERTIDYGALASQVHAVIVGEPVALIETLAGRVLDRCLADPRVVGAEVTVHKPAAPVPVVVDEVAVTLRRSRA